MRRLKRNQREFTYATIKETVEEKDSQNFRTGRREVVYNDPITEKGCVVFQGSSSYKAYGIEEEWSVQIIPDNPLAITVGTKVTIDNKDYFVLAHPTTMNEQRIFCK